MTHRGKPVASVDEALQQNFEKGIVAGLRLSLKLPATMLELHRESFNQLLEQERQNG